MSVKAINYLNIVLMLLSVALAYFFPFELFLVSYAILGPLHYLTEIGWLHKRNYFTKGTNNHWILVGLCLLALLLFLADKVVTNSTGLQAMDGGMLSPWLRTWISSVIIMAFVAALGMVLFTDRLTQLTFTFLVTGMLLLISMLRPYLIILAALLPSLIHVTLFMVAFILYGSMKGKGLSGYLSVVVFLVCCVVFFVFDPGIPYHPSSFFFDRFLQGDFTVLNKMFLGNGDLKEMLLSPRGIQFQRFVAFAYTYHYLNWFSKTKIIDWFNVSIQWRWFALLAWIASVALYFVDFKAGLVAVFFLSMLHVFLEFPLNFRTLITIGQGVKSAFGRYI